MTYQAMSSGWHDFYVVAGTASATLVGLMFVGLSLHLRAVLERSEVRSLARVTLANFALLLFVSLFLVIPQGPSPASVELIISGSVSLALVAPSFVSAARSRTRTLGARLMVMRFGLSAIAYASVVLAGALLGGMAFEPAFNVLVAVTVAVLVVSLRNSWDLLVSVGAAVQAQQSGG